MQKGYSRWGLALLAVLVGATVAAAQPLVVFDQGHGEHFLAGQEGPLDLSRLAGVFVEQGCRVAAEAGALTDERLGQVAVLVISGPFQAFSGAELDSIGRFLQRGGRLAVMLHIGPPVAGLLQTLGVVHSNGVIREREHVIDNEPLNFGVTRLQPHPLTDGLFRFSVHGSWAVQNEGPDTEVLAWSGPESWIDLDGNKQRDGGDAVQSFGVMVAGERGQGRFVVFADDAIFQNSFLDEANLALARNLVRWLAG